MTSPISSDYNAVTSGADRAAGGLPTSNGRPPAPGVDPRLATAVDDTEQQNRKGRNDVSERGEKTKKFTSGMRDIQDRGADNVRNGGKGDTSRGGGSSSGRSAMPSMPQVPQQSPPQQMAQPAQAAAPSPAPSPMPSTPAPAGVSRIDPRVLEALVNAVREQQARGGTDSGLTRDPNSTLSGRDSATSPQSPQPLDVSEVSLEKYPGGPLTPEQTADVIDQALTINGIPNDPALREQWQELYQHMAENESSRNPNAGNNWDSNATGAMMEDGYYANSSRGIWQCIPSTFAAYHMAGTSNSIYDPVASAAASMNYVMQTYKVSPTGEGLAAFMQRQGVGGGSYQGY